MKIELPELCLVALIGASGSGKSTFAREHFKPTEVISSDFCRGLVSDDENSMDATNDAFELLRMIVGKRLARGLLTVIDATNVQESARRSILHLAREHDVLPVAIVLNMPEKLCLERNRGRADRNFGPHVVRNHVRDLRRSLRHLQRDGFRHVFELSSPEEAASVEIARVPLWTNRRSDHGPFDIIGDVHGCYDELIELLEKLGYDTTEKSRIAAPPGRKLIFLGDLIDRGPRSIDVLSLVATLVRQEKALCVAGNHDVKLLKKLQGRNVQVSHGLAETLEQLSAVTDEDRGLLAQFIDSLVSHYVLDDGRLVVAHAGMKQQYIGRASRRVREFALYGETTGETDEFGLPVRLNWAAEYRGDASIVYGHTPVHEPQWLNRTINIDTGCAFGGKLTALRWPERELVSVAAKKMYAQPARPIAPPADVRSAQQQNDDLLDIDDVLGKRVIHTPLHHNVTIRAENAAAALEVMSRFAADPRWLIYLPPTMSPTETSTRDDLLEHPREAFDYYREHGVSEVICQEKHMGSRAVVVVCCDANAAAQRFGVTDGASGIIYTRTGRPFFDDVATQEQLLERIRASVSRANLLDELSTDWLCLDCELMPWSAKAQALLQQQYAAVGSAARESLTSAAEVFRSIAPDHPAAAELAAMRAENEQQQTRIEKYIASYRRYCWPVNSVDDYKLAPFHLLASENAVHADKSHEWHMQTLARLADGGVIIATPNLKVDLNDEPAVVAAENWWTELTAAGGEGMVVKPRDFIARAARGLLQPAIKCRGKEYLRIIYGPEYDAPKNLMRLRTRGLSSKRSLALREFALGIEALSRFVRREPLRAVHECVFGVLAMESEAVDPRL